VFTNFLSLPFQNWIQKHFLKNDIQAHAFNQFYQELLSSSYPLKSNLIQGHKLPCYNLLSSEERSQLQKYIQNSTGLINDYGCGLSFLPEFLEERKHSMIGYDFSSFALHYNREQFPEYEFIPKHLNITPEFPKNSHILISDAFYHLRNPFHHIYRLLKNKPQSLYWIHNFKNPLPFQEMSIKDYDVEVTDFTTNFATLVKAWTEVIKSENVQEERKIFPLIWDTLEKEMAAHEMSLKQNKVQRLHIHIKQK